MQLIHTHLPHKLRMIRTYSLQIHFSTFILDLCLSSCCSNYNILQMSPWWRTCIKIHRCFNWFGLYLRLIRSGIISCRCVKGNRNMSREAVCRSPVFVLDQVKDTRYICCYLFKFSPQWRRQRRMRCGQKMRCGCRRNMNHHFDSHSL